MRRTRVHVLAACHAHHRNQGVPRLPPAGACGVLTACLLQSHVMVPPHLCKFPHCSTYLHATLEVCHSPVSASILIRRRIQTYAQHALSPLSGHLIPLSSLPWLSPSTSRTSLGCLSTTFTIYATFFPTTLKELRHFGIA